MAVTAGRLEGRVALVTGAGSGIGRATAQVLAEHGARTIVVDVNEDAAAETVSFITSAGGFAVAHRTDVADNTDLDRLVRQIESDFGILHVLVNNAGVAGPLGLQIAEQDYDRTVDVNLRGAFFLTSKSIPLLRRAAPVASVIFTSSTSGLIGSPSSPAYSMTKGGTLTLMRSVAKTHGPEGIRSNAVCPGTIMTGMSSVALDPQRQGLSADETLAIARQSGAAVPLRRFGTPMDVARVVLFLAGDDAGFVTGVAIPVDGGRLA